MHEFAIRVRPLDLDDAQALYELRIEALEAHPEAFLRHVDDARTSGVELQRERLAAARERPGESTMLGAFDGRELVGMLGLIRAEARKQRHRAAIVAVYVRPSHRGRGVAGRLLDAALDLARSMTEIETVVLSAASRNASAIDLYRSRGFEVWGVEPDYLRADGRSVDEVHMMLRLDRPD